MTRSFIMARRRLLLPQGVDTGCLDVGPEIFEQLLDRVEHVRMLLGSDVPVVAFTAFVVVTNTAHTSGAVVEPVFERVRAWRNRLGKLPDYDLDD